MDEFSKIIMLVERSLTQGSSYGMIGFMWRTRIDKSNLWQKESEH